MEWTTLVWVLACLVAYLALGAITTVILCRFFRIVKIADEQAEQMRHEPDEVVREG